MSDETQTAAFFVILDFGLYIRSYIATVIRFHMILEKAKNKEKTEIKSDTSLLNKNAIIV